MQEGFSRRVVYGDKMFINLELLLFNFMRLLHTHCLIREIEIPTAVLCYTPI